MNVAILPIPAIGHVNPLLAVTEELCLHPEVARVRSFGPSELSAPFTEAGAEHCSLLPAGTNAPPQDPRVSDLAHKSFVRPLGAIEQTLEAVAEFRPDVVLYDVFSLQGLLAARYLDVPSASFVSFAGYGALGEDFAAAHTARSPALRHANHRYRELLGVDLFDEGFLPALFPSRDLSIVGATESICWPVSRNMPVLPPTAGPCKFVGPCVSEVRVRTDSIALISAPSPPRSVACCPAHDRNADFPFDTLNKAKREGRHIVAFSLGTVLTDFRFHSPVGGAETGRAFLRRMLSYLTAAFADDPDTVVVVATGSLLTDGESPRWPANFVVRHFIPQKRLLERYADAFITHHGMNSMTESLLAGVPMISLPGVGDQIANARMAVRTGAAVALWDLNDPYGTCDGKALRRAVHRAWSDPRHAAACAALRAEMRTAGGAGHAAGLVAGLVGRSCPSPRARRVDLR